MIDIGSSCVQRLLITLVGEKEFKWLNPVENITLATLYRSRFNVQTLPVHNQYTFISNRYKDGAVQSV